MTLEIVQSCKDVRVQPREFRATTTYAVVYFNQAAVMAMLFTNVPVLLKQAFNMDWLALTLTFLGAMAPALLRPVFGLYAMRHNQRLNPMLLAGFSCLITGGFLNTFAALKITIIAVGGIATGLILTITGATLMNVAADTHIVRYTPKDEIARVNSRRRLAAILGIFVGQIFFFVIVGDNAGVLSAWWPFLVLTPIFAAMSLIYLWGVQKKWNPLPPYLNQIQNKEISTRNLGQDAPAKAVKVSSAFLAVLGFAFMYNFPNGLVETPWGNFLFEIYGSNGYATYILLGIAFMPLTMIGAWLAGRKHGERPEMIFFVIAPFLAVFYFIVATQPNYWLIMLLVAGTSILGGFGDVRCFEIMQARSTGTRGPLKFQVLFAVLEIGKYVGVALVAGAMPVYGYAGLFVITGIMYLLQMIFALFLLKTRGEKPQTT
jgi:MFS family permease